MSGRTLLISTPADRPVLRAMILWFARKIASRSGHATSAGFGPGMHTLVVHF